MDDLYFTSKWVDLFLIALLSCDSEQSNLPTLFQTPAVVNRTVNAASQSKNFLTSH